VAVNSVPRGRVVVLSGPTAVGKGTVAACVRERMTDLWVSVSVTTRQPRPGEVDGVHYHFVTDEKFDRLIATGGLLEWATVHKLARYGTPREPVERNSTAGRTTLLELDLQGAMQVRERMPEARLVFLAPPSWEELERRLVGRGTETAEQRERRLQTARDELAAQAAFDEVIVNDEVSVACQKLIDFIHSGALA
jgi:guanylate kinase